MRRRHALALLIVTGALAASDPAAASTADRIPTVARLGGKLPPPALRELAPETPEGALPVVEREAPVEETVNPLGDLTGFVRVDLVFDGAPRVAEADEVKPPAPRAASPRPVRRVAGRSAKPSPPGPAPAPAVAQERPAPADPIVKHSAFRKLARLFAAASAVPARRPSPAPAAEEVARAMLVECEAAPAEEAASDPAPGAPPAAAAKRAAPRPGAIARAAKPVHPGRRFRLPKLPGLADLPLVGRLARRPPEPPARSPEELVAAIKVGSEFRRGRAEGKPPTGAAAAIPGESPRERAMRLFEAGDYAASLEPFAKAAAAEPGRASIRKFRGLALSALDRHDEAVDELAKAAELDASDAGARKALARGLAARGRARLEAGESTGGRADLERALSLDSACGAARRALGQAKAGAFPDRG